MSYDNAITDYWLEHYATEHCTLCGNSGVIDTTGTQTPAGVAVGRKNFCICPNGQLMREHGAVVGVVHEIRPLPDWRKNDSHPLPRGAADMAVLCPDCAKTHEVRVLARDAENQEP